MIMDTATAKKTLRQLFDVAVAAADPTKAVIANLPPPPRGRTCVISIGKAAIPMALAVEARWNKPLEGFAVVPHGYPSKLTKLETLHAGHPVPDTGSVAAARKALALAASLGKDDLLIALVSGGGSALVSLPPSAVTVADKVEVTQALLKSGANIAELNTVRKQLSAFKGGRLAEAAGAARIHTLVMSDVPGNDPAIVASGPTVHDTSTTADALAILDRYRVAVSPVIGNYLATAEPLQHVPRNSNELRVIVSPHDSLLAAQAAAKAMGLNVLNLGDRIEGESREVAKVHAAIALTIAQHNTPVAKPCVILSGGETSVTVRGSGRGGRNVEFALSFALALAGAPNIHALAADTDGIDGLEPIAGAHVAPDTLARARAQGIDPHASLENNDGHGFFAALGDQLVTGPTHTNVNDFRAILIT